MMRTLLIAAVLASLGAARAQAQVSGFVDGNDLHKLCISNSHGAIIYILGVSDAHDEVCRHAFAHLNASSAVRSPTWLASIWRTTRKTVTFLLRRS